MQEFTEAFSILNWWGLTVAYLSSYPGYFREPHWFSMGLLEISRVSWQVGWGQCHHRSWLSLIQLINGWYQRDVNPVNNIWRAQCKTVVFPFADTLQAPQSYYNDITWLSWHLKSAATRLFVHQFGRLTLNKISKLHITGSLWGELTSGFLIPLTKGQ